MREGETPTSARAIGEETLRELYNHNMDISRYPQDIQSDPEPERRNKDPEDSEAGCESGVLDGLID